MPNKISHHLTAWMVEQFRAHTVLSEDLSSVPSSTYDSSLRKTRCALLISTVPILTCTPSTKNILRTYNSITSQPIMMEMPRNVDVHVAE